MQRQPLKVYVERATNLVPAEDASRPWHRRLTILRGMGVMIAFDLNDALITRFGGDTPDVWDPYQFEWINELAAEWTTIRGEFEAYRDSHVGLPETAAVSGLDPDSPEGKHAAPVGRGHWRAVVLIANEKPIEASARHFPGTLKALASCPQMTTVGFSVLDANTHIEGHVGTNKGALRVQLPIIVPGEPGDCRIDVGDETLVWREGQPVMFDLAVWHEAWNDADDIRVLFMIETAMPLRAPLSWFNRFVQYLYRYFPSFRQMPARVGALERELTRT